MLPTSIRVIFSRRDGVRFATPLVVVVKTTNVVFAADFIPAVRAVSRNTFIVYTSNVFALAKLMQAFHYLGFGLALILVFIGSKLLAEIFFALPF